MSINVNPDLEAALERDTLLLFQKQGWEILDATYEFYSEGGGGHGPDLGRSNRSQVLLKTKLISALKCLNQDLPPQAINLAYEELARDRSLQTLVSANQEVYKLLKQGVKVEYQDSQGQEKLERVRVIDWENPDNNDLLLVQQFWVTGEVYTKRADLVGFINGIPLFFGELKAHYNRVKLAYDHNFSEYKKTIPQLFWYNAIVILSNGSDSRIGTITAPWEHFSQWKKISDEEEEGTILLETLIRGTCTPERFLDLVENFILYHQAQGGLHKIVAKYHQYLGVNNAIDAVRNKKQNNGRLGVFWHTQGSGKSFSMVFFSQKILRKMSGNWTFVVVTDRRELDEQIYNNFARSGAVIEPENRVRAGSGEHLKQLLKEDHRYVFTLIHKFHTREGGTFPMLSDRSDVIVMTDEAHRTQYDVLALNMRQALPNAAFIGFTATPLIVGEEKTRQVFGDYVSVYDFQQSMADRATVPLYYENRIPELELSDEMLNEKIDRVLEDAELDDAQDQKLAQYFRKEYHLITRDDRLEKIADDIVEHFVARGYLGKGMVISIDRLTTVRMYEKVQRYWKMKIETLKAQLVSADESELESIKETINFMEETDMAVVISTSGDEVTFFEKHEIDIVPHRKRMKDEDLDEKYKDPHDPFRLVFVCAMWRTGFDAPACSTIYLDRPMRNHTLMQTIARANRVFGEKNNGLIVDYVGIFRSLQKALAIYGTGRGGTLGPGEMPVQSKEELIEDLKRALNDISQFAKNHDVILVNLADERAFERIAAIDDAVEKILKSDDDRDAFLNKAHVVDALFKAILPDTRAGEFYPLAQVVRTMARKIKSLRPVVDISKVTGAIEEVLDQSIQARDYKIHEPGAPYDLSKIDFDLLRERFEKGKKRIETEMLRGKVHAKINRMIHRNPLRMDFLEVYQQMIEEYNAGSRNVEDLFAGLIKLAQELEDEEERAIREKLTEEQLAVFDYLTRPGPDLNEKEIEEVKQIAREMMDTLKKEKLVLDYRKRQQSRAAVKVYIRDMVWKLPEAYSETMCQEKSDQIYQHVYDKYWGPEQSVYMN